MKSVRPLLPLYLVGFIFSLHTALILYSNSSFLNQFISESKLGLLYSAGSLIAIVGLLLIPKMIARIGSRITMLILIMVIFTICLVNAFVGIPWVILAVFGIMFASNVMFYLSNDIIIDQSADHDHMGFIRGSYLTALNIGYVLAPSITGFVLARMGFDALYVIAAILLVPVAILLIKNKSITTIHSSKVNIWKSLLKLWHTKDLRNIVGANFLLQFFYAWMVIYTPLFLNHTLGIPWDSIGTIFSIMLLAFVLTQIPLGRLADTLLGEKWLLVGGFIIMGGSTLLLFFLPHFTLPLLALILFGTRIGASCIEVLTESYFFKKVPKTETGIISIFRNAYPVAYIIAPLIGSAIIAISSIKHLFLILGVICISGIFFIFPIRNTK